MSNRLKRLFLTFQRIRIVKRNPLFLPIPSAYSKSLQHLPNIPKASFANVRTRSENVNPKRRETKKENQIEIAKRENALLSSFYLLQVDSEGKRGSQKRYVSQSTNEDL